MAHFYKTKEQLPLCMGLKKGLVTGGNNVKMVATEIKAQKKLFGDYAAAQKLALFGEEALSISSSTKINERKEEKAKNKKKDKKDKDQKNKKNKEKKHAPKVVNEN